MRAGTTDSCGYGPHTKLLGEDFQLLLMWVGFGPVIWQSYLFALEHKTSGVLGIAQGHISDPIQLLPIRLGACRHQWDLARVRTAGLH